MATSTRPRRAAAPASAEHPARSDDSTAKKPAAKKQAAAKKTPPAAVTQGAEPVAKTAPANRKTATRKAAAPASAPERAPAAKKAAKKPAQKSAPAPAAAPAKKRAPARDAAPAAAPDAATTGVALEKPPASEPVAADKAAARRPASRRAGDKATASDGTARDGAARTSTPSTSTPRTSTPSTGRGNASRASASTLTASAGAASERTSDSGSTPGTSPSGDAALTTSAARKNTATSNHAANKAPAPGKKTTRRRDSTAAPLTEPSAPEQPTTLVEATHAEAARPTPAPSAPPAAPTPPAPPHSAVVLQDGDHRQLRWIAGSACPEALRAAATACTDEAGVLQLDDDGALPTLLREAAAAGHPLQVDPAAWQQLARRRDARQRLFVLEHAYPDGPGSSALQNLLRAPLAPFQAEGALFAACAGRALLADERGLGKTVQALAAAVLLHRHAGVERVLIHCSADQRLSWQREAARFFGAVAPEWRVVSDEPGGPHAEAIDAWKPGLVVIDEPARLARWDRIDAPFALVLCGTPLDGDAALAEALVDYLDRHREGPLARLRARATEDGLDDALQALMLRRRRADVAPQLPARVVSERVLAMGPLQRAVHDRAAAGARTVLAAWRRTRHLTDGQQWELGCAMQAMREACHRAEPGQADSPLAEQTLSALVVLTSELLGHPGLRIAAIAPRAADAALIAERLAQAGQGGDRCAVVPAGAPLPDDAAVVIAIGMPWQVPAADTPPRQWIHLVAEQSIDAALYDTRALREGIACTPAEGGHDGFLHGAALQRYLLAAETALRALPEQPAA